MSVGRETVRYLVAGDAEQKETVHLSSLPRTVP